MNVTALVSPKRLAPLATMLAAGALLALVAGCSDSEKTTPPIIDVPTTATFVGAFTNGTENGKITIVINATSLAGRFRPARPTGPWQARAVASDAAATLKFAGGATTVLTGTYDPASDSLHVTNGTYSLRGEYDTTNPPASVLGVYTGPNGAGGFGALYKGTTAVDIYLGSFQSDSTAVTGTFNLAVCDTFARAIACPVGADPAYMDGRARGAGMVKSLTLIGGVPAGFDLSATGSLDTGLHTASGAWHIYDYGQPKGDDGTWSAAISP